MKAGFLRTSVIAAVALFSLTACEKGPGPGMDPDFSQYPDTPFTIHDESKLIGGPTAQGAIGDVLLQNDRIRVIIQKPRKNAGVNSFGGIIIDADLVRTQGDPGQDNFGSIFPLVNVEWTVNYYNYEVTSDGTGGSPKILRAYGKIDVYDYLDLDFIGDVAEGIVDQRLNFSNRFDDRRNPFDIYDDLTGMSQEVVTDYTLEEGTNYVRIDTTYTNDGKEEVKLPVGQFINGSGHVSMLIPGMGFSPDLMTQVSNATPAVIYAGFDDVDVSYGYFYDANQFVNPETNEPYSTTSVSYSGLTGLLLGEEFLKLAPLGRGGAPEIHFSIPPQSSRTITGYFVVGNGSAGSVLDSGLGALGASARTISGTVLADTGSPVAGATVAVISGSGTLITYRTDHSGHFSGKLPTGGDSVSKNFGKGQYLIKVEVPGHHLNGTQDSGSCEPQEVDLTTQESAHVVCTLGETGQVVLASPVIDTETGRAVPARLTIVGEDPSPNKVGAAGRFRSTIHWEPIFGIVDVKYITALGTFDLTGSDSFDLEPGTYLIVASRGPEYTAHEQLVEVPAGGTVTLEGIEIRRAVATPGYISADFHIHSVVSPDSNLGQELRVLSAAAEALDVLQSSDHDYLTDYAPVASRLMSQGIIPPGGMQTSVGDEVTPNHYGHIHAFPLIRDDDDPEGGAMDWSYTDMDEVSPAPDYVLPIDQLIERLRDDPGEEVIQINHIMDNPTGIPVAAGWVTSPFYMKDFGVAPLSAYADPVERRMSPASGLARPFPLGATGLMATDFDAIELTIGLHLHDNNLLFRSALPTWFNLLNLGMILTATSNSDSHRAAANPVGLPRNFIASSVDPRDGLGTDHAAIDLEEYATSIKAHKVTVSAGPIVMMRASGDGGNSAEIGGTVTGRKVSFTIEVGAPSWAWFDTVEIYANTEPIPVDDDTDMPMQGKAADPATFYKPYHIPHYIYQPVMRFKLSDETLANWKEEDGVITASVTFDLEVDDDTWVVALARGSRSTDGYRSLFPIVTRALIDAKDEPETFDPANLAHFHAHDTVGASAWGFTNPIFIDVDGDGFTAKYVREGISPLGQ